MTENIILYIANINKICYSILEKSKGGYQKTFDQLSKIALILD